MRLLRHGLAIPTLLGGYLMILIAVAAILLPARFQAFSTPWIIGLVIGGFALWWVGCRLANGSRRSALGRLPRNKDTVPIAAAAPASHRSQEKEEVPVP